MCCIVALAALIGPRIAIIVWLVLDPARWAAAFGSGFVLPIIGFLFLPWTTLVFVWLAPFGGIGDLGLLWLLLALVVDLGAYSGGYRSRQWGPAV